MPSSRAAWCSSSLCIEPPAAATRSSSCSTFAGSGESSGRSSTPSARIASICRCSPRSASRSRVASSTTPSPSPEPCQVRFGWRRRYSCSSSSIRSVCRWYCSAVPCRNTQLRVACAWVPCCSSSSSLSSRAGRPSISALPVRDERGVDADLADLPRAAGRAERGVPAGQDLGEERPVVGDERLPLLGHPAVLADRLHRAHRLAGAAVDALLGVDVALAVPLVDAVDGALVHAGLVVDVDAGAGDHVGHGCSPQTLAGTGALSVEWPGNSCAAGSSSTAALLTAVATSPNPTLISRTLPSYSTMSPAA